MSVGFVDRESVSYHANVMQEWGTTNMIGPIHDSQAHQDAPEAIVNITALDAPDEAELAMLETLAVRVERFLFHEKLQIPADILISRADSSASS